MSVAVRLILPEDWFYVTLCSILLSCPCHGGEIIVQVLQICPSVERETYLDPWLINQDRRKVPGIISTTKQTTVPNSFISKGRESKLKLR